MAVDSSNKAGTTVPATGTPSAGTPSPTATLTGMPAVAANGKSRTRKRPSSLMAQASSLPSVESSLDEFIARANETLVDTAGFNAELVRKEEDEKRKEADALRWKAAEQQMRESQAREEALRRQLDGLQGKLAEAEARAAVASAGGSQDGVIADLKVRLTATDERLRAAEEQTRSLQDAARSAEERAGKLAQEVIAAKAAAAAAPPVPAASLSFGDDAELEQRLKIAETKAAKAIAAAKAASMGLTVNPADIAAIESGLVVPMDTGKKGTNWGLVIAAVLVGGAVAFAAAFVVLKKNDAPTAAASTAPAAEQAQPQAAPAPAPAPAPAQPIVTPIEEPAPAAAAPAPAAPAAAAPVVEEPKAEEPKAEAPKAAAAEEPKAEEPKAAPAKKAVPARKAPKKAAKKAPAGGLADPFGDAPAPKKKEKKPAGGIVDPF